MSQLWAGAGWGGMSIPRIGHEVVVDFVDGDPDRPIIIGRVYHGTNKPPYTLPDDMTKTTWKSCTSTGGEGYNELRFEDKKDSEEIFVHAQKDWNIEVENDKSETVGANETVAIEGDAERTVSGNQTEAVTGDREITVDGDHVESIGGDMSLAVDGDKDEDISKGSTETVAKDKSITVSGDFKLTVEGEQTLAAAKTITIKCGDGKVIVEKDGTVTIKGKDITVKGDGTIKLEGQKLKMKSDGTAEIEASGAVKLKGSGVEIN